MKITLELDNLDELNQFLTLVEQTSPPAPSPVPGPEPVPPAPVQAVEAVPPPPPLA